MIRLIADILLFLLFVNSLAIVLYYVATGGVYDEVFYSTSLGRGWCHMFSWALVGVALAGSALYLGMLGVLVSGTKLSKTASVNIHTVMAEMVSIVAWIAISMLLLQSKKELLISAWLVSIGIWNTIMRSRFILMKHFDLPFFVYGSKVVSFLMVAILCSVCVSFCIASLPGTKDLVMEISYGLVLFISSLYMLFRCVSQ